MSPGLYALVLKEGVEVGAVEANRAADAVEGHLVSRDESADASLADAEVCAGVLDVHEFDFWLAVWGPCHAVSP